MCTACCTKPIRILVDDPQKHLGTSPEHKGYTLRAGYGVLKSGLLIVDSQDEVAYFDFWVFSNEPPFITRRAMPKDDPKLVNKAMLKVEYPASWARFVVRYAELKGIAPDDYDILVKDLESEALALYPQLAGLMREAYEREHPPEADE